MICLYPSFTTHVIHYSVVIQQCFSRLDTSTNFVLITSFYFFVEWTHLGKHQNSTEQWKRWLNFQPCILVTSHPSRPFDGVAAHRLKGTPTVRQVLWTTSSEQYWFSPLLVLDQKSLQYMSCFIQCSIHVLCKCYYDFIYLQTVGTVHRFR